MTTRYLRKIDLAFVDDDRDMPDKDKIIEVGMRLAETGRLRPEEAPAEALDKLTMSNNYKVQLVRDLMSLNRIRVNDSAANKYLRYHLRELATWADEEIAPGIKTCEIVGTEMIFV